MQIDYFAWILTQFPIVSPVLLTLKCVTLDCPITTLFGETDTLQLAQAFAGQAKNTPIIKIPINFLTVSILTLSPTVLMF